MHQVATEDDDEGLALGEIIAVLMDYRWLIAAICLMALLLGLGLGVCQQAGVPSGWPAAGRRKELRYGLAEGSATAAG
jgi:hypothetical protein